jgi:glucosamine kinase
MARDLWRLPSVEALIEVGNAEPRPRFAELAPLVVECAEHGDVIAAEILAHGGRDLAYLAQLVLERIMAAEDARYPLPAVAIAGSVLGKVGRVRDVLMSSLRDRYPQIEFVLEPADPVVGALYLARGAP